MPDCILLLQSTLVEHVETHAYTSLHLKYTDRCSEPQTVLIVLLLFQLQASYCIADDVIDCSDIRRGKPTWHTLDDTGVNALIDSSFTHYIIFDILRSLLDNPSFHESFRPITNSFLRCHKKTMIGALHELIALQRDYATFTLSESRILGIYKTGYYTQMLPIFVGMNFSGIQDPELYRRAEDALAPMGHLYQAEVASTLRFNIINLKIPSITFRTTIAIASCPRRSWGSRVLTYAKESAVGSLSLYWKSLILHRKRCCWITTEN